MTVELGIRGPVFFQWLPLGPENGIRLCRGDLELVLWLDVKSVQWAREVAEEDIHNHINLTAHRIYADITATMDDVELLSYMPVRDFSQLPTKEEEPLAERYEIHGREVFSLFADGVNRLLTFIRVEKGQFWLNPLEIDLERMAFLSAEFEAKAQVDGGPWFRWQPTHPAVLWVEAPIFREAPSRYLTPADWPEAQAYVSAEGQPNLTRQLLAAAEAFADTGSERVALTEAVTALEVAVSQFMDSPKADYQLSEPLRSRLGLESLKSLKKRQRSLMASVSFPLPILFDSDTLTSETLATCREAIRKRNQVVHDGLLYIDPATCRRFLSGIRNFCEVLLEATASKQRNSG
jgi:hypothetical protein